MKELIICFTENKWYSLEISTDNFTESHEISSINTYYTFQVSDFIREVKSKKMKAVPKIINLESFDKQFSQKGKDLLNSKKWHILKALRNGDIISSNYRITDLKDFLLKIKEFVEKLRENAYNEIERFNNVELKINEIINRSSYEGVKIDRKILNKKCIDLHKKIYEIKNEFQFSHNIFQPENFATQVKYINEKKYKILESIERTINLLRKSDPICAQFNLLNKYIADLRTLVILKSRLGGGDYVMPYYVGFGTITSRIIIKEPSLQNLRKDNRDIIIPNHHKELFYLDYNQFEASILAHYSSDQKLIDLVNFKDVYSDMVINIYGKAVNEESRKEAKILFYRFLYGDTFENKRERELKKKVETYFNKFIELSKFSENKRKEALDNGHVNPLNGNIRKLDINNDNIWILSHLIQSTASYIFKNSIIETYQKVKKARLLIPLHDGALYEIDIFDKDKTKKQIIDIFIKTFQKECNSLINPKAEECAFYKS